MSVSNDKGPPQEKLQQERSQQEESQQDAARRVELGRFGKVYGLKGWIRLNSYTSPADTICGYGTLAAKIGDKWTKLALEEFRRQGNSLVVHIKGYDDPETARLLTGKSIWIESSELPALPEGEFYWHQLLGLQVVSQHGENFGKVAELLETGANDVFVVEATADSIDQRQRLIPYLSGSVVQQVNLVDGWIRVNWEADYLE